MSKHIVELCFTDLRGFGLADVLRLYGGHQWVKAVARGDHDCLLCGATLTPRDVVVHAQCHAPHRETGIETMLNVGACSSCLEARGRNLKKLTWDMGEYILANALRGDDLELKEAA